MSGVVPYVFRDCADIFIFDKDEKYADCPDDNSTGPLDYCYLLKETHRAKEFRTYFLAIIPVVLSVFALILNIVFIIIQWIAWRQAKRGYKKRYIFLLFRAGTSVFTLLLFYVLLIVWKSQGFEYSSVTIFLLIGSHDFLAIAATYLVLTVLLYTAIVHPMFYKLNLRLIHCIAIMGAIWAVTLVGSILIGLYGATLFYPDSAPIPCTFSGCRQPLAICIVVLLAVGYLTVIGLYAILLLRMRRRTLRHTESTRSEGSQHRTQSSITAMNRMAMNMLTFSMGSIPLLVVAIMALAQLEQLSMIGEGKKSSCKSFVYSDIYVQVEILASVAALIWVLSMVLDPLINVMADPKLVELIKIFLKKIRCQKDEKL